MNRQTKASQIDAAAGAAETLWRAAFLILSGGFQDAYTYVCRGGVFANAQTGNVVLMSAKLMRGEWRAAVTYLIPLAAFFTGTFAAETIRRRLEKSGRHRVNRAVLAVEIALLFCVGFLPQQENALANALVSLACAAQVQTFQTVCGYPEKGIKEPTLPVDLSDRMRVSVCQHHVYRQPAQWCGGLYGMAAQP